MTLVVEDGSGVEDANTFASVEDLEAYATARGLTLPATDAAKEKLLILALDAIETLERTFLGMRTSATQELSWPRTDPCGEDGAITLSNGQVVAADAIPKQLIAAQCQLACDQQDTAFFQVTDGRLITEETVGPLTTRYADSSGGGGSGGSVHFQKFESIIAILQRLPVFRTVRV
jgi:hypothetical protein